MIRSAGGPHEVVSGRYKQVLYGNATPSGAPQPLQAPHKRKKRRRSKEVRVRIIWSNFKYNRGQKKGKEVRRQECKQARMQRKK